ncbi:MAG: hypothetical protein ACLU37_07915 [Collinsella sp.]
MFNNTYKKPETPVPTPDPGTPKTVTNIVKTVRASCHHEATSRLPPCSWRL